MDKKRLFNLAYWVMIVVVISFCIFLYFYLTSEAKTCLEDPIAMYEKATNLVCVCSDLTNNNLFGNVKFDVIP